MINVTLGNIDITTIMTFVAFFMAFWNMTSRIDAMGARIDQQGQRIDDLHRDFNALHKEIMELIKKLK